VVQGIATKVRQTSVNGLPGGTYTVVAYARHPEKPGHIYAKDEVGKKTIKRARQAMKKTVREELQKIKKGEN